MNVATKRITEIIISDEEVAEFATLTTEEKIQFIASKLLLVGD